MKPRGFSSLTANIFILLKHNCDDFAAQYLQNIHTFFGEKKNVEKSLSLPLVTTFIATFSFITSPPQNIDKKMEQFGALKVNVKVSF